MRLLIWLIIGHVDSIDNETYMADFKELDKDEDGGIGFGDLNRWISSKIETVGKLMF